MKITKEIIERYHEGTCTAAEEKAVERWLQEAKAEQSYPPAVDMDRMQKEAWQGFEKKYRPLPPPLHSQKASSSVWLRGGIAAGICFLIAFAYGYYSYQAGIIAFPGKKQVDFIAVFAPKGKKKTLLLPDGSKVYLNAGSTLHYVKSFNDKRLLILEGEAFFEVAKQPNKPFIVQTKNSQIDVLGTRFNLKSYLEENKTYVTVEEGCVRFSPDKRIQPIILTANKQATYQADNQHLDTLTTHNQIGWKTGYLVFDGDPLIEIVPVLERWYNIRITISDPKLYNYRIRGRYPSPSLQSLLEDLAFTTNIHFRINGSQITLYK